MERLPSVLDVRDQAGGAMGRLTGGIASKMLFAVSGEGPMTDENDENEELDELDKLLADALEPRDDLPIPPLDMEALGMEFMSRARPPARDNKGGGRKGE